MSGDMPSEVRAMRSQRFVRSLACSSRAAGALAGPVLWWSTPAQHWPPGEGLDPLHRGDLARLVVVEDHPRRLRVCSSKASPPKRPQG